MSVTTHVRCLTLPSHSCPQEDILFTTSYEIHPMVDLSFTVAHANLQCRFLAELYLLLMIEPFVAYQPPKPQSTWPVHNEGSQPVDSALKETTRHARNPSK